MMSDQGQNRQTPQDASLSRGLTGKPGFIHIKKLFKSYAGPSSEVEVLKGLDLTVHQGDTISIVGASGTGKSTLLHILGTLDRPSAGQIIMEGQDLFDMDEASLASFRNRHIGFIFQFHHLMPEFNALENTMMPALIARVERPRARELALSLLEEVGLSHRLDHRVGELSGGEQQRVAVARALVLGPKLLLADEPTGNLDERTGRKVQELLVRLNQSHGLTTVVATHNERLAGAMGRRLKLVEGQVVEQQQGAL